MSAIRNDDFNHREPSSDLRKEVEQLRLQVGDLRHRLESKGNKEQSQPGNEKKPEEEKEAKEEKEKPEAPLLQRAKAWVHENPAKSIGLLVLLAVLLVGGGLWWHHLNSFESTDDAEIDGHLDSVSSRVSGTVRSVSAEDNESVAQSQVLVELDRSDYQLAVNQARGNLLQTESQLAAENPAIPITEASNHSASVNAQADVTSAEAGAAAALHDYDSAVADQRQAEAESVRASNDEARYRQLAAKDEVSRELYDQKLADARASSAVTQAKAAAAESARRKIAESAATVESAKSRLAETQANNPRRILVNRATVATRNAAVQAAKAQLDQALLNLSYCTIEAPSTGVIGNKTVEAGQHIEAGQPLFMITQTNDIWVTADYKETQLRQMKAGQPVTIAVDALGLEFDGYVESMPGATGAKYSLLPPENASGNYIKVVQRLPVRIRLKAGQSGIDRLRPGMSVETSVRIR